MYSTHLLWMTLLISSAYEYKQATEILLQHLKFSLRNCFLFLLNRLDSNQVPSHIAVFIFLNYWFPENLKI